MIIDWAIFLFILLNETCETLETVFINEKFDIYKNW